MVASTLLVEADLSGTAFGGTFVPTDITRFVRLVDGIPINGWRQDAASDISPTTFSLTLDNDALTGDATAPNAGRFTPGLSSSPWTGKLLPGVRMRITETVGGIPFQLADGYVLDWTTQPAAEDGTFPVTKVNCVDILGWMGELQPLRAIVVEEILQFDNPAALYALDEAAGATSAGDATGKNAAAVVATSKYGPGSLAFGVDTPLIGVPGVSITAPDAGVATGAERGTYLVAPNAMPASGAWSIGVLFQAPSSPPPDAQYLLSLPGGAPTVNGPAGQIGIDISAGLGFLHARVIGSAALINLSSIVSISDGGWHYAVLAFNGTTTLTWIVDGVVNNSQTVGGNIAWANPGSQWNVGTFNDAGSIGGFFAGTLALFGQYGSALSTARALAHWTAMLTAFAGERTDVHIARLLGYRPGVGSVLDVGAGVIGAQDTRGGTLTDALLATAKAEGGVLFADGQGRIVFFNRSRLYDPPAAATFDAEADLDGSNFQVRIDTQQLINDMTVSRPGGASQRAISATSQTTYGPRQKSDTYILNSDRDAADAAGWIVVNGKTALVRTPSLDADLVTMTSTAQAQAILSRAPLDRIALSNLPAWAPPTDVMVQGRSIRISDSEFAVSFFTSSLPRKTLRADAVASANTKLDNGLVIPR